MQTRAVLIVNGPGAADPAAGVTLQSIEETCGACCDEVGLNLEFRSTDEADVIAGWIAAEGGNYDALIVNPAGADDCNAIRAAIEMTARAGKPLVEVHLANVFRRGAAAHEPLRGPDGATGFICGMGAHGYTLGIRAVAARLRD